jgi:hypothetical protein
MAGKVALAGTLPLNHRGRRAVASSFTFRINPRLVLLILVGATFALTALDLFSFELNRVAGTVQVRRILNVDEEPSIPTWFSSIQLFVAQAILLAIAWVKFKQRDSYARHWALLAIVFLGLSMDEVAAIHEASTLITGRLGDDIPWTASGAILVLCLGALYVRFLFDLPRDVALLFCLGAAVLVGGALGIEMIDLQNNTEAFALTFQHDVIVNTEEFCERLGVAIFIYGLLVYVKDHMGIAEFSITSTGDAAPSSAELPA